MRVRKIDSNQTEIVEELRRIGCSVAVTSGAGDGFPDLLVGHIGRNYLLEIKDGNKPPSKQKLTGDQIKFHGSWTGQIAVVNSIEQAIHVVLNTG